MEPPQDTRKSVDQTMLQNGREVRVEYRNVDEPLQKIIDISAGVGLFSAIAWMAAAENASAHNGERITNGIFKSNSSLIGIMNEILVRCRF